MTNGAASIRRPARAGAARRRFSLIIFFLENHPKLAPHIEPLFEAHGTERLRFAVTTITIAEVLTGPLRAGDEAVARRYRATLGGWQVVELAVCEYDRYG
jgi:hypothetical protein